MKKLKIAFVTDVIYPFTFGGSEIRNYEVAKRLVKLGHEVHIFGAKFWAGPKDIQIEGIKIHGVSKYERLYNPEGKRRILDPIKLAFNLLFELSKYKFDIIDCLSFVYLNCFSCKLASMIGGAELVLTWQQYFGNYLQGYFGSIVGTITRVLERLTIGLTKNHIVVSEKVGRELSLRLGFPKRKITLIPNGVDYNLARIAKKSHFSSDIVFVGRLNYQKNPQLLIEAIKILKKDFPKIKAIFLGAGSEIKNLQRLVNSYALQNNVSFLGLVKDKIKLFSILKSSKIFVLPSRLEGFPLTILEANACGLPAITTKTQWNDVQDYLSGNGISGMVVKPQEHSLAKAIAFLLENRKTLSEMSKNAVAKTGEYDWDIITKNLKNFYYKVF
ncbi:glycosyltransferase family 4 protein [Candidatus Pacearchaeota archaeon]|nr:glycosyltransferase family 4 protein [Candidatus Pacearchaeota archaeon]